MDNALLYIAGVAFIGGITSALLGWLDSNEAFNIRKFTYSIVHSIVAGVGFALTYPYIPPLTAAMLMVAFLGGMGVDAGLNRAEGAIAARLKR